MVDVSTGPGRGTEYRLEESGLLLEQRGLLMALGMGMKIDMTING